MEGRASEKITGGKLVRLQLEYTSLINKAIITGDFFLHPEDKLECIEQCLRNLPLTLSEEEFQKQIEKTVQQENILMVGITPDAIARLVKKAIQ